MRDAGGQSEFPLSNNVIEIMLHHVLLANGIEEITSHPSPSLSLAPFYLTLTLSLFISLNLIYMCT